MLRLNYRVGSEIVSKIFDTVDEGFEFALANIVNQGDRDYYKECCGLTFEDIRGESDNLKVCVLKNALENVVFVCEE